jgi:hypothetical protein
MRTSLSERDIAWTGSTAISSEPDDRQVAQAVIHRVVARSHLSQPVTLSYTAPGIYSPVEAPSYIAAGMTFPSILGPPETVGSITPLVGHPSGFPEVIAAVGKRVHSFVRDRKIVECTSAYLLANVLFPQNTPRGQIFASIQNLSTSGGGNNSRDRKIAQRLMALYRDALCDNETMSAPSIAQFTDFFLKHPQLGMPKITLTPEGNVRVRWIGGQGNFAAVEFTGDPIVKLVAQIPREDGKTARYFGGESLGSIVSSARAIGAYLG